MFCITNAFIRWLSARHRLEKRRQTKHSKSICREQAGFREKRETPVKYNQALVARKLRTAFPPGLQCRFRFHVVLMEALNPGEPHNSLIHASTIRGGLSVCTSHINLCGSQNRDRGGAHIHHQDDRGF